MAILFRILAAALALTLLAAPTAAAAPVEPDRLAATDRFVEDQMSRLRVPGVAYAVVADGEVVHQRGFGVDGDGAPVTAATPFLWGSLAKPVAAAVTVELARRGILALDDPVRTHLPGFDLADHAAAARITVRNLLQHTSGLPFGATHLDLSTPGRRPADVLRELASLNPVSPPGTEHHYSSLNYLILAAVVESATGRAYPDVLAEAVGDPLAMDGLVATAAEADRVPRGHRYLAGGPVPVVTGYDPAGAAYGYLGGTLEDLAAFARGQLHPSDPTTTALLHAPGPETGSGRRYGLGWRITDLPDRPRMIWHSGTVPGYFAAVLLLPDSDQAVVMLMNISGIFHESALLATPMGVADLLSGRSPAHVPIDPAYRWLLGALVAAAAALLATLVAALFRRRPVSTHRAALSFATWTAVAAVTVVAASWGVPALFDAPPRYLWQWAPDLAILSWTVAGSAVSVAVARAWRLAATV